MNDYLTQTDCLTEIAALKKGDSRTWAEIGLLLGSVEFHGLWRQEETSFTSWLKSLSVVLSKSEGSLWRYLTSARYYQLIRKELLAKQIECPELKNLSDRISPENLELLAKLDRVAPTEVIESLTERVLAGVATRSELRDAWDMFKPILNGRTARGNLGIPKYDPNDLSQSQRRLDALVHRTLSDGKNEWGAKWVQNIYCLYACVKTYPMPRMSREYAFDFVMITGIISKPKRIYHGIVVISWGNLAMLEDLINLKQFCDYLWVGIHESQLASDLLKEINLLDTVGVLVFTDSSKFYIHKEAVNDSESGKALSALKEGMLLKIFQ